MMSKRRTHVYFSTLRVGGPHRYRYRCFSTPFDGTRSCRWTRLPTSGRFCRSQNLASTPTLLERPLLSHASRCPWVACLAHICTAASDAVHLNTSVMIGRSTQSKSSAGWTNGAKASLENWTTERRLRSLGRYLSFEAIFFHMSRHAMQCYFNKRLPRRPWREQQTRLFKSKCVLMSTHMVIVG